jgi:uncharacterized protein (TIGR00369 family)
MKGRTEREERLEFLKRYFDEKVPFSGHVVGTRVGDLGEGWAVVHLDVEERHLNGGGTLHGGVHATLLDNAMGIAAITAAGSRVATMQMDVRFLGPVDGGRITSRAAVVHRTRRTVTTEGKTHDEAGNLISMGTATFRVFEGEGEPLV